MKVIAAVILLQLTGPDGQIIWLDIDKITTIRVPRDEKHFGAGVHCHIFTVDGKNINVKETCEQVKEMLRRK